MPSLARRIMEKIDERYLSSVNARPVKGSNLKLLLICFHPYEGIGAELPDKTTIKPGDQVVELHLSNKKIASYTESQGKTPEWQILQDLRQEFSLLAREVIEGSIPEDVKGFYGVNVLPAGARRLGFTLIPLPQGWNRIWLAWWESLIRRVYYYNPDKKTDFGKTKNAYEIWLSRSGLIKRYGNIGNQ
jgi:hypothetical protein